MGDHLTQDQAKIDAFDVAKWGRCAQTRPGDTVSVHGMLPCGKLGRTELAQVINACVSKDGFGELVLVATAGYGRKWFGTRPGPWRMLKLVAKAP